jgi:hypothetical protein
MYELRAGQFATGQVWPEAAFTLGAVTLPALDVLGLKPKNLPPLGITSGRLGSGLLREQKRERKHK